MNSIVDLVARYAKGHMAAIGVIASAVMHGNDFCGSVWPTVASAVSAALVILVPNKTKPKD